MESLDDRIVPSSSPFWYSSTAPGVVTHFFVYTPENTHAGQSTPFEVVALDAANRLVPGYSGTVHFTSNDSNAVLPADYSFSAADHGYHKFSEIPSATGSETLTATDSASSSINGSATLNVNAAQSVTHFAVYAREDAFSGGNINFYVVALDANNSPVPAYAGTVHFSSSDANAVLPSDYAFSASDHGYHMFSATLSSTGDQSISASDSANSSIAGSTTISINAAPSATHFAVIAREQVGYVGAPATFVVAAMDASNHVVSNYIGTVHLSSSDSGAALPADYTFSASDYGYHKFLVTPSAASIPSGSNSGSITVSATDAANSSLAGSATLNVNGPQTVNPATHLSVYARTDSVAGTINFYVSARDANNHPVSSYTGTIHLTSSDPNAILPADYTFTAADNGYHLFTATLSSPGNQTISAADTANSSINGSASISIHAAPVATHFAIWSDSTPYVGVSTTMVVQALDASNNVVQNYVGTVHITSSDSGATLPADFTFTASDSGYYKFSVTPSASGSFTLTATDDANSSIMGSATMYASAAPVVTRIWIYGGHDSLTGQPFPIGQQITIAVIADDANNSIDPAYAGTVHFTSSDSGATLPADYTFTAADHGVHLFKVTFSAAGSQTITVSDAANSFISTGSFDVG